MLQQVGRLQRRVLLNRSVGRPPRRGGSTPGWPAMARERAASPHPHPACPPRTWPPGRCTPAAAGGRRCPLGQQTTGSPRGAPPPERLRGSRRWCSRAPAESGQLRGWVGGRVGGMGLSGGRPLSSAGSRAAAERSRARAAERARPCFTTRERARTCSAAGQGVAENHDPLAPRVLPLHHLQPQGGRQGPMKTGR